LLIGDSLADGDADGLANLGEYSLGSQPCNTDTDGDGMPDGWEVANSGCGLNLMTGDSLDDGDADGLANLVEYSLGSEPCNTDTDGDGMPDGWEFSNAGCGLNLLIGDTLDDGDADGISNLGEYSLGSEPCNTDTDGDGMDDGWENTYSICGLNLLANDTALDPDSDGLNNIGEYNNSSDPCASDTDGDGLSDGDEMNIHFTDPADPDTDGDGLSDGYEINTSATQPLNPDTDGDGLSDGNEISVWSTDPLGDDSDNDGISDGFEVLISTDPAVSDSDGDGVSDGEEALIYLTDPQSNDTDGDGMTDAWEIFFACVDPLVADESLDPDGDGQDNSIEYGSSTDPCSAVDTDGDGMPDGWEDSYACVDSLTGDSLGDPDADGRNNLVEFQERTDPCVSDVAGPPPTLINYQGRLTDGAGVAVSDTVTMTFDLFDGETSATVLWNEMHLVDVKEGVYSLLLGGSTALPGTEMALPDLFMEITVDGEVLSPRSKITSVPSAVSADRLEGSRLEIGSRSMVISSPVSARTVHVVFKRPFSTPPRITVTGLDGLIGGETFVESRIYNVTTTGFDVEWKSLSGAEAAGSADFGYYAFGD
jgi:hypothetical protein